MAIYAVAASLGELIFLFTNAIGIVLFRKVAQEKNTNNQVLILAKAHRETIILAFFASIILSISAWFLIPLLYGNAYLESRLILLIYIVGVFLYCSATILSKQFSANGLFFINTKIQFISLLCSIPIYLFLIKAFNEYGAAISSTLGFFIASLVSIIFIKTNFEVNLNNFFKIQKMILRVYLKG